MQEYQIDIRPTELMAGLECPLRGVDESLIHDLDAGLGELLPHPIQVTLEPLLQSRELRPVRVQTNAEQSDLQWGHGGSPWHDSRHEGRDEAAGESGTNLAPEVNSIVSRVSGR